MSQIVGFEVPFRMRGAGRGLGQQSDSALDAPSATFLQKSGPVPSRCVESDGIASRPVPRPGQSSAGVARSPVYGPLQSRPRGSRIRGGKLRIVISSFCVLQRIFRARRMFE